MRPHLFGALLAIALLTGAACAQATPTPAVTFAIPTATSTASTPTATAAPALLNIPRLGQRPSQLLRVMGKLPASFKEQGMWFSDYDRAMELAGAPRPSSMEEYMALSKDARRAYNAADQIMNRRDLLEIARSGGRVWEEAFGFGRFDIDLLASFGSSNFHPLQLAYLEGDFRQEEIRERLLDLGYEERFAGESVYYAIRGDYKGGDLQDPVALRAGGNMNRVFVEDGTLVASPETDRMVKVLEHSAGKTPALADYAGFYSLAKSLGDPLSAALLTRSAAIKLDENPNRGYPLGATPTIFEKPKSWGALRQWEAVGAGYLIADDSAWWGLSLFYSNPDAAGADAEELVRRMTDHKTAELIFYQGPSEPRPPQQPNQPFKEFCDSLSSTVHSDENGSTLTAWCKVGDNPIANEWWSTFLRMQDLRFLMP